MLKVYYKSKCILIRDEIINLCQKKDLGIEFSSPFINHKLSDNYAPDSLTLILSLLGMINICNSQ